MGSSVIAMQTIVARTASESENRAALVPANALTHHNSRQQLLVFDDLRVSADRERADRTMVNAKIGAS